MNKPTTIELDAEVRRAFEAANFAAGLNLPTDAKTIALIRANLHGGDYELRRREVTDAR